MSPLALLVWVAAVGTSALAAVFAALADTERGGFTLHSWPWVVISGVLVLAVATFGTTRIARDPRRSVGWLAGGLAFALALAMLGQEYVLYALGRKPVGAPLYEWAALAGSLVPLVIVLVAPFFVILAPEGRWRSRGWRRLMLPLGILGGIALLFLAVAPGPLRTFTAIDNPIGVDALSVANTVAMWLGIPVAAIMLLVGVVALPLADVEESDEPEAEGEYEQIRRKRRARREGKRSAFLFLKDFPRVLPYLRPHLHLVGALLSLLAVSVVVGLLSPWPLALLVDTVLGGKPPPHLLGFMNGWGQNTLLVIAVTGSLVVTGVAGAVGVAETYIQTRLELGMELNVKSDMFEHAQKLSQAYHDKKRTGGLMFAMNNQATAVAEVPVVLPPLVASFATLIGMFVIAFKIDPTLALVSLTVVPFIYASTGFYAKRIEPRLYYVRNLEGQTMTIIYEAISMLRVIVSFGREKHEYRRFRDQGEEAVGARVGLTLRQTLFSLAVTMITATGTALVLGFGAWHVLHHKLTAGELLVVLSYIASVYAPLHEISTTFANLQQMFINMQMAFDLLDTEPEIRDSPDAIELDRSKGHVTFERVSFKHLGRKRRTLKRVSFDAPPGTRVGLVGATGAGKTTLVSLIPRFYDRERGRILIDGTDIKDVTISSLRKQISIVHQDPLLFSGSIIDNIRYGRLDATDEEIVEAARGANAHDFIDDLPDGYKTRLGEGGALLSGGERQRVAIARAFLKDAPILILDEPTASIDSHTEAVILEALDRLAGNRTTFTIAHRLSTLGSADLILVLDHGRLIESGSHEELMAMPDGHYRKTHELQRGRTLHLVPPPPAGASAALPSYSGSTEPLLGALRLLLTAPPKELDEISRGTKEPLEIRLAAGILGVLSREDREKLRALDDKQLVAMLDEVRR